MPRRGGKYRLDKTVDSLTSVMHGLLAARAPGANLVWPGRSLRLADGTCVSRPGSTGTDWRVHGVFDLGAGGFSHLEVTDGKGPESILRGAAAAGEVRIADRYGRVPRRGVGAVGKSPAGATATSLA